MKQDDHLTDHPGPTLILPAQHGLDAVTVAVQHTGLARSRVRGRACIKPTPGVSLDGQTVRVDPQQVPPVEGRVREILELRLTTPVDASVCA